MSGKKLSDYGLTNNFGIGFATAPGEEPVMLQVHGFRTTDDRTRAVQKWKDGSAKAGPGKNGK